MKLRVDDGEQRTSMLRDFEGSTQVHYRDKPNTVVMQCMVLFSHLTVLLPSDALSQKHEAAV